MKGKGVARRPQLTFILCPTSFSMGGSRPTPVPTPPSAWYAYARLKLFDVVLPARIYLPSVLDPNHNAIFNPNRLVTVT